MIYLYVKIRYNKLEITWEKMIVLSSSESSRLVAEIDYCRWLLDVAAFS